MRLGSANERKEKGENKALITQVTNPQRCRCGCTSAAGAVRVEENFRACNNLLVWYFFPNVTIEVHMKRLLFSLCLAIGTVVCGAGIARASANGASATSFATQANPMTLVLDARPAPRGLMYAHLTIPVKPGPFTLVYPKWIPGEHGPTGPLSDLAGLKISAGGRTLDWRRDKVDMYAFHVNVPAGVSTLDVDFDVLVNAAGDTMSTANLAVINWNRDVLYQARTNSHQVFVKPSIILPAGWSYGTALPDAKQTGDRVDFGEVPLAMLVDSPLDCGRYYKHILLGTNNGADDYLDAFADRPQDLDFKPKLLAAYKRMVPEALALYGSRHWTVYHALLALSNAIGFQGIEHHQSSDDRAPGDFMTNPTEQLVAGDLITHEYSHSWNGKYRRPADLTTPNFQVPMKTDLLWVYEGMNQYLGDLLSFRAGIRQPKEYPEYLATLYAAMNTEPGRLTDPLIDTTTAAPYLYEARGQYSSIRRTAGDFYTEGELLWLDVDTIIRAKTGGKKSLDTFLHLYAGPPDTGPITKTYTRAQIEALLNDVVHYNWHAFFQRHVYEIAKHPPAGELARSGWKFVYTDKPNSFLTAEESLRHGIDDWYSLGLQIGGNGAVYDVREGSPAWDAGLAPGMTITAVDGQSFESGTLAYAMKTAQHSRAPISLLVEQDKWYKSYQIDYHGGERYPHLVRIAGKPDMLAKIMAPHAPK